MNILFIPISNFNFYSNEHIPNRLRLLSQDHKILGLELKGDPHIGVESFSGLVKNLLYSLKVLFYALKHKKQIDLIFCWEAYYAVVGIFIALLLKKPCIRDNAIVTGFHHSEMGTWKSRVTTIAASLADRTLFRLLDLLVVLTPLDKASYVNTGFKPERIVVAPLYADPTFPARLPSGKNDLRKKLGLAQNTKFLIFSGGRDYLPNLKAAEWINQKLIPELYFRHKNLEYIFTGSGPLPVSAHSAARFTGFVPNYFEYLCCADIALVPLYPKSGILVKVLDSMSCGLPSVITTEVAKGIPELVDGDNAMIAADESEFINKTIYLLDHPEQASIIGARARETAQYYYSFETCRQSLNSVLAGFNNRK